MITLFLFGVQPSPMPNAQADVVEQKTVQEQKQEAKQLK
jgi:hypothetical protein